MFTGSHVSFYCNFYFISIAILCIYPDVAGAFLLRCYLSVLINGCNLPIGRCITEGCCMLIGKHLLFGIYKDNRCLNLICLSYLNRCLILCKLDGFHIGVGLILSSYDMCCNGLSKLLLRAIYCLIGYHIGLKVLRKH